MKFLVPIESSGKRNNRNILECKCEYKVEAAQAKALGNNRNILECKLRTTLRPLPVRR